MLDEKSVEEVENSIHCISNNFPIQILLENCGDAQNSNSIKWKKNLEKGDVTSYLVLDISNSIDFRTDGSISVNSSIGVNGRRHGRANSKIFGNNSNVEFNDHTCIHVYAYRCRVNKTVLVNTSCEDEFISNVLGENVTQNLLLTTYSVKN